RVFQLFEGRFGAVEHAGLEKVMGQFVLCVLALGLGQVGATEQALMHADGPLHFAPAAKQAAQGKVQFGGFGVELGDFDEGVDGAVGLFIEQEVQATEV